MSLFLWASMAHRHDAEQIGMDSTKLPPVGAVLSQRSPVRPSFTFPLPGHNQGVDVRPPRCSPCS